MMQPPRGVGGGSCTHRLGLGPRLGPSSPPWTTTTSSFALLWFAELPLWRRPQRLALPCREADVSIKSAIIRRPAGGEGDHPVEPARSLALSCLDAMRRRARHRHDGPSLGESVCCPVAQQVTPRYPPLMECFIWEVGFDLVDVDERLNRLQLLP